MNDDWQEWIGREQCTTGRLDRMHGLRWCSTFNLEWPDDGVMPQGIHLALCAPSSRSDSLGEDGHPVRDICDTDILPPIPLPRRMWASSAMRFHAPIAIGADIRRISRTASITPKSGSRGDMVFVELDHDTYVDGILAVSERQTLVYLEGLSADAPLSPPEPGEGRFDPAEWDAHHTILPDERLLFRYSALTFNSHRIHYDASYAREVERYRGLVVHGPLSASLMLQLAGEHFGQNRLTAFTFRGVSPAIAGEVLHLVCRGTGEAIEMGAFADDGRQVVNANARLT